MEEFPMSMPTSIDSTSLNQWYAIAAVSDVTPNSIGSSTLLETPINYTVNREGTIGTAWRSSSHLHEDNAGNPTSPGSQLPVRLAYGYLWTSLGKPEAEIFPIPEYDEPDRRRVHAGTIGVHTSAPRAIENFLDMGHFPYVHTGILGVEPYTEVKEYDVEISVERDEILATRCRFYQPKGSSVAKTGIDVDYIYRVPHPFCSVLYKMAGPDKTRPNVIALFLQPVDQEHVRAHMLMCILDDENEDKAIRSFQQTIFGQDKPILENQLPKRLPLDPRAETPIRADKSAVAYRRWLSQKGVNYGAIPVPV
jgi:phenylpropionate dioxygenase-like ring-hydroxylating dioxygenase large terminal subunit